MFGTRGRARPGEVLPQGQRYKEARRLQGGAERAPLGAENSSGLRPEGRIGAKNRKPHQGPQRRESAVFWEAEYIIAQKMTISVNETFRYAIHGPDTASRIGVFFITMTLVL